MTTTARDTMTTASNTTKWASVRLDRETLAALQAIAAEEDRTVPTVIRRLVAQHRPQDRSGAAMRDVREEARVPVVSTPVARPAAAAQGTASQADRLAVARAAIAPFTKQQQSKGRG